MRTRNCWLNGYLRMCATKVSVFCVISLFLLTGQPSPLPSLAQDATDHRLFIPLTQAARPASADVLSKTLIPGEWTRHTSVTGGYSILVPTGWEVTDLKRGIVQLTPPSGLLAEKVWIEYLHYEMPQLASLLEWAKAYHVIHSMGTVERYTPVSLSVKASRGESTQVFYQKAPSLGQGYLISHGQLVLVVFTRSGDETNVANLAKIANSVEFAPAAPVNMVELYAPEAPPEITTLEAYGQQITDYEIAARAFTERVNTGETPVALLATMSDRARQEYERLLVDFADVVEENDKMREEMERLRANPPAPLDQSEYEESERRYNATLEDP